VIKKLSICLTTRRRIILKIRLGKLAGKMSTCSIVLIIGLGVGVLHKTFDAIKTRNFFIA